MYILILYAQCSSEEARALWPPVLVDTNLRRRTRVLTPGPILLWPRHKWAWWDRTWKATSELQPLTPCLKQTYASQTSHPDWSILKGPTLEQDSALSWVKQTSWLCGSRLELFPCASTRLPESLTTQGHSGHPGQQGNGRGCRKNYISLHLFFFFNRNGYFGKELTGWAV